MFWWLRKIFWWPRYNYEVVVGKSHASAEEAKQNALIQATRAGGEIVGIAASAMCCAKDEQAAGGAEWDVYLLIRK